MNFYLTNDLDKALQFDDARDAREVASAYEKERNRIATVCRAPRGFVVRCYQPKTRDGRLLFDAWIK
jgi:hypothetical protein